MKRHALPELTEIEGARMSPTEMVPGREYIYQHAIPADAQNERYRFLAFVLDVPSYQTKALVEALTGKDRGLLFTCSIANFCVRYTPVPVAPPTPPQETSC